MTTLADLFDGYALGAAYDEMISADGSARAPYRALHESLQRSGAQELRAGVDALARAYLNQGVTFDVGGEERPFPLDLVRYYLGEEPELKNVDTWRLEDPGALEGVLDRLDELVVKPVDAPAARVWSSARRPPRPSWRSCATS